MQNLKPLTSLYSRAGQFESYLVGNPEDRFSHDVAHIVSTFSLLKPRKHLHILLIMSLGDGNSSAIITHCMELVFLCFLRF